jgi:nucleotide-binding universal stress UspA family protein
MALDVLLAVDGSEKSNKAVDHVGDVVCNCGDFSVTLLHVIDVPPAFREHPGAEDPDEERRLEVELKESKQQWMKDSQAQLEKTIFGPAKERLTAKGITMDKTKIRTKIAADAHSDVAAAIVDEAKRGGYGVVAIGRRGKSTLKAFLMGTVVHKVVHNVEGCAVWVVE